MLRKKDKKVIYWSSGFSPGPTNYGLLYRGDIETLYDKIKNESVIKGKENNLLYCPAMRDATQNTIILYNTLKSAFDITENTIVPKTKGFITSTIERRPNLHNKLQFQYGLNWLFFSEHDIEASLTSPYFDIPKHTQYGSLVPGTLNISKWFRPLHPEFILNENVNEFVIEKDEPVAYVRFHTTDSLVFRRFHKTQDIDEIVSAVMHNTKNWEQWVPLASRYKRFKESRMKDLLLKKLEENVIYENE